MAHDQRAHGLSQLEMEIDHDIFNWFRQKSITKFSPIFMFGNRMRMEPSIKLF